MIFEKYNLKPKIIFFLLYLFVFYRGICQEQKKIYKGFHFSTSFSNVYTKFYHESYSGNITIKTPYTPGLAIGAGFMYNLTSNFGIETGLSYILENQYYKISSKSRNIIHTDNINLPLNLEFRIQVSDRYFCSVAGGINYNIYEDWAWGYLRIRDPKIKIPDNNGDYQEVESAWMNKIKSSELYLFSFHLVKQQDNKSLLKVGLFYNYCKEDRFILEYYNLNKEYPVGGYLIATKSYFGISIGYVFTNLKKKK